MEQIDETIGRLEQLYLRVTGQKPRDGERQSLTDRMDPVITLNQRLGELLGLLSDPMVAQRIQPWAPPVNVWELEDRYLIRLDVPGVKKEDVDIGIQGPHLVVHGVRRLTPEKSGVPRILEARGGAFQRILAIPPNCTAEIHSDMKDGTLGISLPKNQGNQPGREQPKEKKNKVQ